MVPRSTPLSRIHTSSVVPDSASGSPDEKPRNSTISTRGFRYTASASKKPGRGGALSGEASITLFARPELARHRRGDDLCSRWLFVEINTLNFLPATQYFFGRRDNLLDVLVDVAEVFIKIIDAVFEPLHIFDHERDFFQNFVRSLAHASVLLDLLDNLDR